MTTPPESTRQLFRTQGALALYQHRDATVQAKGLPATSTLEVCNLGPSHMAVDRLTFNSDKGTVTVPLDRLLAPGERITLMEPATYNVLDQIAQARGIHDFMRYDTLYQLTIFGATSQGSVEVRHVVEWGFGMGSAGHGFYLRQAL